MEISNWISEIEAIKSNYNSIILIILTDKSNIKERPEEIFYIRKLVNKKRLIEEKNPDEPSPEKKKINFTTYFKSKFAKKFYNLLDDPIIIKLINEDQFIKKINNKSSESYYRNCLSVILNYVLKNPSSFEHIINFKNEVTHVIVSGFSNRKEIEFNLTDGDVLIIKTGIKEFTTCLY